MESSMETMRSGIESNHRAAAIGESAGRVRSRLHVVLWVVQVLLAVLFVFGGGVKLILPLEALAKQTQLPGLFMRFIGIAELLGGLGLVLPGLLRVRTGLTPLAAGGLVIIMIGAVVVTVSNVSIAGALFPAGVLLLAGFVAYGRWRLEPLSEG